MDAIFLHLVQGSLGGASAANGLPLEEKSLSEILGTDEDGSPEEGCFCAAVP